MSHDDKPKRKKRRKVYRCICCRAVRTIKGGMCSFCLLGGL